MIAISIPIHESMDCVVDLVENIRHYEPNSYLILHASKIFSSFEAEKLKPYENVFINPKRNPTGLGLLTHHISNFKFLQKHVSFDSFVIMSSNEMLIKYGLEEHVKKYKNGFQATFRHQRPTWHLFNRFQNAGHKWSDQAPQDFDFVKNPEYITWESDCPDNCPDNPHGHQMKALMKQLGLKEIIGGQTEGQFYETGIFEQISEIYHKIWGFDNHVAGYETEECVPMMVAKTILKSKKEKQTAPITLQNYTQYIDFNKNFIEKVKQDDFQLDLHDNSNPGCLCSAHLPPTLYCPNHENWSNSKYIYSLKRIPRRHDDPIRKLIRSYYK